MDTAVAMMKEHFQRRSRALSPTKIVDSHPWYSVPPRLQIYDESIINIFLNLARNHLADSFSVFAYFEAMPGMRQELCLAMAAVGGLFCSVEGSNKIAKALYNDARRMLLASFYMDNKHSFNAAMTASMTSILLEIYGMCSGDKRTYELAEAFHPLVLLSLRSCRSLLPSARPSTEHEQYRLLTVAAQVLESYRILSLLVPPTHLPFYNASVANDDLPGDESLESEYLSYLMTPGTTSTGVPKNMSNVAMLSCYCWFACPRGVEKPGQDPLWKVDFIELAFDRWKWDPEPESSRESLPRMLFYYMAHVSMHSNLGFLQRVAHNSAKSRTAISQHTLPPSIRKWAKEGHPKITNWHAESIMGLAAKAIELSRRSPPGERSLQVRFFEPPHLAYCTYFACLVTWYEAMFSSSNYRERDARAEAGAELLFAMKLRVAKVLGNALCELFSDNPEGASR